MTEQTAPALDQTPEPIEQQADPKAKYAEGQVLSINYTATGPVKVVWRSGKQVVEENRPDPNPEVPGRMSRKEIMALLNFTSVTDHLLSREGRKLPVMLQEVEQVIDKAKIKSLARKGLIEIQTLTMVNDDKKKMSYAFCWMTSLGLGVRAKWATAKKELDAQYAAAEQPAPEVPVETAPHSD